MQNENMSCIELAAIGESLLDHDKLYIYLSYEDTDLEFSHKVLGGTSKVAGSEYHGGCICVNAPTGTDIKLGIYSNPDFELLYSNKEPYEALYTTEHQGDSHVTEEYSPESKITGEMIENALMSATDGDIAIENEGVEREVLYFEGVLERFTLCTSVESRITIKPIIEGLARVRGLDIQDMVFDTKVGTPIREITTSNGYQVPDVVIETVAV